MLEENMSFDELPTDGVVTHPARPPRPNESRTTYTILHAVGAKLGEGCGCCASALEKLCGIRSLSSFCQDGMVISRSIDPKSHIRSDHSSNDHSRTCETPGSNLITMQRFFNEVDANRAGRKQKLTEWTVLQCC